MTATMNVCPCCFAVSPRDPGTALGQASRCPHCGASAVMDPVDEINQHPPLPREQTAESATSYPAVATRETATPRGRTWTGAIGQFLFGTMAVVGLGLCLFSTCAATYLFYQEAAYKPGFGLEGPHVAGLIEFLVKLSYCAAVAGIAIVGAAIHVLFGVLSRRWPRSLLGFGICSAILGTSPLIIQILLTTGWILLNLLCGPRVS